MEKDLKLFERWIKLLDGELKYKEAKLREPLSVEALDAEFSKLLEQEN